MYARGDVAKALCQRCGLLYLLPELIMDGYYPNIRVCEECYDPPQPQEKLAVVSDAVALWRPAVDTMYVSPPVLTATPSGSNVVLTWSGFNQAAFSGNITGNPVHGLAGSVSGGANITAGYYVQRSADQVNWTTLANLVNTQNDLNEPIVETTTYTDTPGLGTWYYRILGYDVLFNDSYG